MELVKLKYCVNQILPQYVYGTRISDIAKNNVSAVDCFRLFFDESLNKVTQSCKMDLMVRFLTKTRLWEQRSLPKLLILIP